MSDNLKIRLEWRGAVADGAVRVVRTGDHPINHQTRQVIGEVARKLADDIDRQITKLESS